VTDAASIHRLLATKHGNNEEKASRFSGHCKQHFEFLRNLGAFEVVGKEPHLIPAWTSTKTSFHCEIEENSFMVVDGNLLNDILALSVIFEYIAFDEVAEEKLGVRVPLFGDNKEVVDADGMMPFLMKLFLCKSVGEMLRSHGHVDGADFFEAEFSSMCSQDTKNTHEYFINDYESGAYLKKSVLTPITFFVIAHEMGHLMCNKQKAIREKISKSSIDRFIKSNVDINGVFAVHLEQDNRILSEVCADSIAIQYTLATLFPSAANHVEFLKSLLINLRSLFFFQRTTDYVRMAVRENTIIKYDEIGDEDQPFTMMMRKTEEGMKASQEYLGYMGSRIRWSGLEICAIGNTKELTKIHDLPECVVASNILDEVKSKYDRRVLKPIDDWLVDKLAAATGSKIFENPMEGFKEESKGQRVLWL